MNESQKMRSLSEAANYVIKEFRQLGICIAAKSRFMREYKAVCNDDGSSRGYILENNSHFVFALEALRDITQLEFFFDQTKNDPQKEKYISILKECTKDLVSPVVTKVDTRGRDKQAELFIFSVCKNAGLEPVLEEPDVTCKMNGKKFGIAVKRIKCFSKFVRRVKEGAGQIQGTSIPGIISADVTVMLNPNNYRIITNFSEPNVKSELVKILRAIVDRCYKKLCNTVQDKGVRGIFLHMHYPIRFQKDYVLRSMTYGVETAKEDQDKKEWCKFKDAFFKGLPNLIL
jgi:hypothetical protein